MSEYSKLEQRVVSIDKPLLREQKQFLLNLRPSSVVTASDMDYIEGLISLVDSLQDGMVEDLGMSEDEVFA